MLRRGKRLNVWASAADVTEFPYSPIRKRFTENLGRRGIPQKYLGSKIKNGKFSRFLIKLSKIVNTLSGLEFKIRWSACVAAIDKFVNVLIDLGFSVAQRRLTLCGVFNGFLFKFQLLF